MKSLYKKLVCNLLILINMRIVQSNENCENEDCNIAELTTWRFCDQSLATIDDCICHKTPEKDIKTEKWTRIPGLPIEVFSAFLDTRNWKEPSEIPKKPPEKLTVRIIAHGFQAAYNNIGPIHCHSTVDNQFLYFGKAEYVRIYVSTAHHDEFTAHFILCYIPESLSAKMSTISLSARICEENKENIVDLIVLRPLSPPVPGPSNKYPTFGICVSPIWGTAIKPLQLAEFVENHRIFGADKFTFYLHFVGNQELLKLLHYYEQKGIALLVNWPLPRNKYFYFDQRSALNDCLYRNMGRTDWVGFMDLDEIFTSRRRQSESLPELLESQASQAKNGPLGTVCFQHVYFENNPKDPNSVYSPPFISQTRFYRTEAIYPAGKVRSKCIHRPELMVATDIHFGQWWLNTSVIEVMLNGENGILQHYRNGRFEKVIKNPEQFPFVSEYFMLKYRDKVTERVKAIFDKIGISF